MSGRDASSVFPVQWDEHNLTVLRYLERQPPRANIVKRSQDGEWSNLKPTVRSGPESRRSYVRILKPSKWTRHVNSVQAEAKNKIAPLLR